MSYANMMLYNSVIPSYRKDKDEKTKDKGDYVNADDPANIDKLNAFIAGGD